MLNQGLLWYVHSSFPQVLVPSTHNNLDTMKLIPPWAQYMYNDGLVQDCCNAIVKTLEIPQSCTKPLIYRQTSNISLTKSQHCFSSRLAVIFAKSMVWSWEWRCCWSSADRRCSNYIWLHDQQSWSTLAHLKACCLMAPSPYLNQCWFVKLSSIRSCGIHLRYFTWCAPKLLKLNYILIKQDCVCCLCKSYWKTLVIIWLCLTVNVYFPDIL